MTLSGTTSVGLILKTQRVMKGMTEDDVAYRLNTSPAQVKLVENNTRRLEPELLGPWCDTLGLPPGQIFVLVLNGFARDYARKTGLDIDVNFAVRDN